MTASGAVLSGRNMGLIGLACLFSTLVSIDGPFLQKATTIKSAALEAPAVTLNVTVSQEVPTDSTGGWYEVNDDWYRLSRNFNKTIPTAQGETSNWIIPQYYMDGYLQGAWFRDDPISGAVNGCPRDSKCSATVRAPAFAVTSCVSKSVDVDYWLPLRNVTNLRQDTNVAPPFSTISFVVDISLVLDESESVNLITGHSHTDNCTGVLTYDICTLRSAIGEYNVTIKNGNQVILDDAEPRIVALANNTRVSQNWNAIQQWHPSTLAGVVYLAYQKWESSQQSYYQHGVVWTTGLYTNIADRYIDLDSSRGQVCFSFLDPQKDVLLDLNRMMFMLGAHRNTQNGSHVASEVEAAIDPGLPVHTTIPGYLEGSQDVFVTYLRWWAAAAVVELVCVALILPTYFGWWRLGRSVSFSPLEVAKGFEAPLLNDCNSNSSGKDISNAIGDVRVQYGETHHRQAEEGEGAAANKLAFADPSIVSFPRSDTRFDS